MASTIRPDKLTDILDKLANIEGVYIGDKPEKIEELLNDFRRYYRYNPRHKYHEIAKYILDLSKKEKETETIATITENLQAVYSYLDEKLPCSPGQNKYTCYETRTGERCGHKTSSCMEDKRLLKSLIKLEDHIQLESMRWNEVIKSNEYFEKNTKALGKKTQQISVTLEKITADTKELNKKTQRINSDIKKATSSLYMQIVSILGIFTAIVFGVFGGVKAIESVGTVIAQPDVNVCHIVIAATLIILFVVWVIYLLFVCIRGLMEKEVTMPKINCAVWWISGGCIIMIIVAMFIVHF